MSEKKDSASKAKQFEAEEEEKRNNEALPEAPPPYFELGSLPQPAGPQQPNYGPPAGAPPGYSNSEQKQDNYDPLNDPNVYKVSPQIVDITRSNPAHLNPDYIQYQERDRQRFAQGDFPKPREAFRHGAPLAPGRTDPTNLTGKGFPGRSGVSYKNAANK